VNAVGKRGRPSSAKYPVVTAIHVDSGAAVAWSDGVFAGDVALVAAAREAARQAIPWALTATGPVVAAGDKNPLGAAAAMLSVRPGRMMLACSLPELALPPGALG